MARSAKTEKVIAGRSLWLILASIVLCGTLPNASAARLDEMSLDRWKKLREVERYQLQIAEKYYRDKKWKVALAEYEKYLA